MLQLKMPMSMSLLLLKNVVAAVMIEVTKKWFASTGNSSNTEAYAALFSKRMKPIHEPLLVLDCAT